MEKKQMEEQNNPNFANDTSAVDTTSEVATKKAFPKLPVIIGAAVAGVALIAVLLIILLGGKNVDIAFKEDAMPQTVFVLGENIDLAGGVLIVDENGKKLEIDMGDESVSVSGYDKNTLGKQIVDITYMDKTLQLEVTVVERMQVVDYVADYLIGDAFDLSMGRVKITRNDGSNYTVMLKSDKVTVSEFNSSTTGEKNLTVSFVSGSDTYTANIKVNVHSVENVTLSNPTKISYNSHDAGVDVAGGVLTLSALNGKIKKTVTVTEDMISDFDLSAVNESNSPLTQIVNVNYDGKSYPFEIVITYTNVSKFKDHKYLVADLDWSGKEAPEITKEQGTAALEMMELYLDMAPSEKSLLTREETLNMARAAIVYGFNLWADDINKFSGAFGVEYGEFTLYAYTREDIEDAIVKLEDTERPIYELYDLLDGMVSIFGSEENDELVYGDVYFSNYPTIDPAIYDELLDVFEFMLELDDVMDYVGADWRDDINKYAEEIENVFETITTSDFYSYSYAQFIYCVSEWREGNDAFDFLYEYYYSLEDTTVAVNAIMQLANIRLPKPLEPVFAHIYQAMNLLESMNSNPLFTGVYDASEFLYNYLMAVKYGNELLDAGDPMMIELFYGLPLNGMLGMTADEFYYFSDMFEYLTTSEGGYYTICGSLLGVPAFESLLASYVDVLNKSFEVEGYIDTDEYKAAIETMFGYYLELTPAQQISFIQMLNLCSSFGIPPYAFDTEGDYAEFTAVFFDIVNKVYFGMFETENGKDAYHALILATEIYTQRYTVDTWLNDFVSLMNEAEAKLLLLTGNDLTIFTERFKDIYDEYIMIRDLRMSELEEDEEGDGTTEDGTETPGTDETPEEEEVLDFGDWEDEMLELYNALLGVDLSYRLIEENVYYLDMFFSAFERADYLATKILTEAPDNIRYYFLHSDLYCLTEIDKMLDPDFQPEDGVEIYWSFDYTLNANRPLYNGLKVSLGLMDYYEELGLDEFMNKSYDIIWPMWFTTEDGEAVSYDKEKVIDALNCFSKLSLEAKVVFISYIAGANGEDSMYYFALEDFISSTYGDNDALTTVINALMDIEMSYIEFGYLGGSESKTALTNARDELVNLYITLSEADKKLFDEDFGEIYSYYLELIEKALTEAPEENV